VHKRRGYFKLISIRIYGFAVVILPGLKREKIITTRKKEGTVISQYMLYSATSGSKPISPIPTTIPMMQMLNFVTLNDIHFVLV
jgi:hypothetical protein